MANGGMQFVDGRWKISSQQRLRFWTARHYVSPRCSDLESRGASFRFDGEAKGDPAAQGFLQALLHLRQLKFQVHPLLLLLPAVLLHLLKSLR